MTGAIEAAFSTIIRLNISHWIKTGQKLFGMQNQTNRMYKDAVTASRCCILSIFLLIYMVTWTAACSSRTTPKRRPSSPYITTTISSIAETTDVAITQQQRPNITLPIFKCPPAYAAWYCLNDATCFTVEIHHEILYNCECAIGFIGPRCEYKEIDDSYLPTRQRAMLETASIASGATLALFIMLILCLSLYIRHEKVQKMKMHSHHQDATMSAHDNLGLDEIDGTSIRKTNIMRPFGSHHYQILPMWTAFKH